ncbi:MAG: hypothetical protein KIT57_03645 [Blastocatellales bacterium]|nr:hypothetical protein [Blastocatellales bacterium]
MNIEKRLDNLEEVVAQRGDPDAKRRAQFPDVTDGEMAEIRSLYTAVFPETTGQSDVQILGLRADIEKIFGDKSKFGCRECRSRPMAEIRDRADLDRLWNTPLTRCPACNYGYWPA